MPKWAQVAFLLIGLGLLVFVPTRRLGSSGYERGFEFVFLKQGKVEWDRLGFELAIVGVVAAIGFVATRKGSSQ